MPASLKSEQTMVAYALEIDEALLPFVPELLQDFDELGSDADLIAEVLADLNLPKSAKVLDLGCGKGAVSVEIATELGVSVLGIDLFKPFIPLCEERALKAGVSHLCTFQHGNILNLTGELEPADVVIYAALGDVLGSLDRTVGIIRQFVKPGGYMVVNDDFSREDASANFKGFGTLVPHAETLKRLQSHGDAIIREVLETQESLSEEFEKEGAHLRRRAEALAKKHPELKEAFLAFASSQIEEYQFMEDIIVPAIWILKKPTDLKKQE